MKNNIEIKNILFDFWETYMDCETSDARDMTIEKAVGEIDNLLQSKKDNLVKQLKTQKREHIGSADGPVKSEVWGYNQAIEDVLSLIQEEL